MTTRDEALRAIELASGELIQRANRAHLYTELIRASGLDIDQAVFLVFSCVGRIGPARVADVATAVGIGPTTSSRHLTTLERLGVVRRAPDPSDGRAAMVALTPAGQQSFAAARSANARLLGALVADWTEDELADFADYFKRFTEALISRGSTAID